MDPHLQEILGPDPTPFETLISNLMKPSNEVRSHAESLFILCKQTDPNTLVKKLVNLLEHSPRLELRAMSAVLLRNLFKQTDANTMVQDEPPLWNSLLESTRSCVKSGLLNCVVNEQNRSIIRLLSDTISEFAANILADNGWPELIPFMLGRVAREDFRSQESALRIFARLAEYVGDSLVPHITPLHDVFMNCLGNIGSADVRIAALSAVINFIQCLESSSDRDRFQDLLPGMMQCSTEVLDGGNEATVQKALVLLIELAGTKPKFLRRQLAEVVESMLQIAEAERLEEGTRHLAIEFLITLVEAKDQATRIMKKKSPQLISRLFAILMRMLLDIEDEAEWNSAENEDEDVGESSNYSVGQECLHRLATALGGNTIVPVAYEQLCAYLAAPEWQKHAAAPVALAQIAKFNLLWEMNRNLEQVVMNRNLEQVVTMVLNSFQDPHPRVRWAAVNAIGQLSTYLGHWQDQYHASVLPALALALDDFQNPRVQAHAYSTVLNFGEKCRPDLLTPYIDGIVSKLIVLPQTAMLILGPLRLFTENHPISLRVYYACLENASADIRIAAFGAAIGYIRCTDGVLDVRLVPAMKRVLAAGLNEGQEVTTQEALKLLIEWAHQIKPGPFARLFSKSYDAKRQKHLEDYSSRNHLDKLVKFASSALMIAKLRSLKNESRHLAIDFLITLAEGWFKSDREVIKLFGILMPVIENASHWADNEDDDAGELRNCSVLQKFLDRMVFRILDHYSIVWIILKSYLRASEWQTRVIGIVALARFSKVFKETKDRTKDSFDEKLTMVVDLFQDSHHRVRLAAINAAGQLFTDLNPDLQLQYHRLVLPALAKAIYDFQYPQVQAHAASAVVDISKNFPRDTLTPYLFDIVGTLLEFRRREDTVLDQTRILAIENLLKQFRLKLPRDTWASTWSTLLDHQQGEFLSILAHRQDKENDTRQNHI